MTIQVPYRGIIEIVGDHDVGKTIAALQTTNNMKDVVFVDDDVKGEGTVRQMVEQGMEFDDYIDLAKLRLSINKETPTADELIEYVVLPTIERIKQKKHKIIVWDTWRIVYQSARGHVERNKSRYNNVVDFSKGTSTMIQGLVSKVARMIEMKQMNELKSVCELLIITHHIKDNYVQNIIVGKRPESSATFSEVCNIRMWLRRNTQSKVPVMLFLKRPSMPKMIKGKLRFVNIVPLKITPTNEHESIWDAIKEYEDNPFESRTPRADETPTPEEFAAISGTLTNEQKDYVRSMIEFQKMMEKELSGAVETSQDIPKSSPEPSGRKENEKMDNVPSNGIQLLGMAKSQLGMDIKQIETILKMPFKEINDTFKKEYWDLLNENVRVETLVAEVKKKKK